MAKKQQRSKHTINNEVVKTEIWANINEAKMDDELTNNLRLLIEDRVRYILTSFMKESIKEESGESIDADSGLLSADEGIYSELFECCGGGKYVRGISIAINATDFMRSRITSDKKFNDAIEPILDIAAAIEIFQTAMLVHDDIIDKDELRRGRPSSYIKLGTEKALLLGDLLLTVADHALDSGIHKLSLSNKNIIDHKIAANIRFIWNKMKRDVLVGQAFDYRIGLTDLGKLNDEEAMKLSSEATLTMQLKTASYTTVAPYIIGRLIGSNDSTFLDAREGIMEQIANGILFQIDNDISGLKKDLISGNTSCAMVITYNVANEADRAKMRGCIASGKSISDTDLSWMQKLMQKEAKN